MLAQQAALYPPAGQEHGGGAAVMGALAGVFFYPAAEFAEGCSSGSPGKCLRACEFFARHGQPAHVFERAGRPCHVKNSHALRMTIAHFGHFHAAHA
jgi:hypothetical protein